MSSKLTENYQLCQWERTDKVLMADFNSDNAKIDSAIKAVDRRVDGLSSTVASQGGSLSSHGSAISRLGNCAIQTLTYTGTNTTSKTVSFSGYPVMVIVRGVGGIGYMMFMRGTDTPLTPYSNPDKYPTTWGSRSFTWSASSASSAMNSSGSEYYILALLDMSK